MARTGRSWRAAAIAVALTACAVPDGVGPAAAPEPVAAVAPVVAAGDSGSVLPFGAAPALGGPVTPVAREVAIAPTPSGDGYWVAAADGGVFTFGDARFAGSTGALRLQRPIVDLAATRSGAGYWLVADDGGVFTFGDARFAGSAAALPLSAPVVGVAATPTGGGYWLAAADGGVFTYGDARFHGSAGSLPLTAPIVAIAGTPTGNGYWLAAADGGVFTYGDAGFHGSGAGRVPGDRVVVDLATAPGGYWMATGTAMVRVALTGDVHGEGPVRSLLARGGTPFADTAAVLGAADVAVINLETAVGSLGEPATKEYVFQADPALLRAARDAGVDVVSLANNHSLDYGVDALFETITNARAAGLAVVGAGRNAAEAYAPAVVGAPGRRVAVVGLTAVLSGGWAATAGRPGLASAYDVRAATAAVQRAAGVADHVVVMIHWGTENLPCPTPGVRRLADELVAAGADVIGGHHPHVLQPIETRAGAALVAYSLGNFVWYHHRSPTDETGVLTAELGPGGVRGHSFTPARIDGTGTPRLTAGASWPATTRRC